MSQLSKLAESLIGSEIVKLGNEISNQIAKGEKIYNYTIGDFNPEIFPIPKSLEEYVINAYKEHYTNYPPGDGYKDLKQAVIDFIKKYQGIDYGWNEVQIASGGRPVIYTTFRALVDKDDKVLYVAPSWNNNHYTHLNWGTHCIIEAKPENNFMPLAEDIAPHIQDAALLCLCSPQNPTGTVFTKKALEDICKLVLEENARRKAEEKKLYVLYDQMYWMLTYGDTQHYNPVMLFPEMKAYTVFVDGISKAFAATGLRVGWALGPEKIIQKIKAFLSHIGAWAPMAEQVAIAKFLKDTPAMDEFMEGFKKGLEERLQLFYDGFMQLKSKGYPVDAISPQAALYLTVRINLMGKVVNGEVLEKQSDVTSYLLKEAHLAIVPFSAFGCCVDEGWYRISVGTAKTEDIADVLHDLENALLNACTNEEMVLA